MIVFVVFKDIDQGRKGREKNDSEFTAFHFPCCNPPGPSRRLSEDFGSLIDICPTGQDLDSNLSRGIFEESFDDCFGDSFFAQVELLSRDVPNDREVITNIV